jgi:osmotically-inducible protein OsmY
MGKTTFARGVTFLACLASLLAAGVFSASEGQTRQEQTTEECYLINDEALRQRVIAALRSHRPPIEGIENIRVRVTRRVASVEGTVQSSGDKRAIYEIAKRVSCIDCVDTNGLKLSCPNLKKARQNAAAMLAMGLSCNAYKGVNVSTAFAGSGNPAIVATLTGSVPSSALKAFAESLADAADCVDSVRNQLDVRPQPFPNDCGTVTDEELRVRVETAINLRLSCFASTDIRVIIRNKIATLTGTTILGRRQLAHKAAEEVPCVELVISDQLGEIGPACPVGARTCTTLEGEQWCCVGCKRCPLN